MWEQLAQRREAEPKARPHLHNFIVAELLQTLPRSKYLGLPALVFTEQRKTTVIHNFRMAQSHGNWTYFINQLTDEEMLAIYEMCICIKAIHGYKRANLSFLQEG